jgi:bifunctional DNase/RNase
LIIRRNGDLISVDARPSDSIAVALRLNARIFAEDDLLEQATVEISEEESVSFEPGDSEALRDPEEKAENLKDYLRKLNPEDFGRFSA